MQAAADEGDPEAQYALGVLYANLLEDSMVKSVKVQCSETSAVTHDFWGNPMVKSVESNVFFRG